MDNIDFPDVLKAIARRLASVEIPGLEGVSYPMRADIPRSPWIMLRGSDAFPASYLPARLGEQVVSAPVDIVALVKAGSDPQREQARLDPMIGPILDALDAAAHGMSPADLLGLPAHRFDHIRTEAQVNRRPVDWAGTNCYAAVISIDPQFRRTARPVPMKEVTTP